MTLDRKVVGSIEGEGSGGDPGGLGPPATQAPVEEGAPLWTTTFGDLMSLLLTFFILLYSMSEIRVEKFVLAARSLSDALSGTALEAPEDPLSPLEGPLEPDVMGAERTPEVLSAAEALMRVDVLVEEHMDRLLERLRTFIRENDLENTLSASASENGVHVRIESSAIFPSGSGTMHPESRWILEYLGEITRTLEIPAVVSGHTDNEPIQTSQFASNWELSAARAAGVARELVSGGHDPLMVRVESFGEHRPLASNETPLGRAQNRRVEILFSREDIAQATRRWIAEERAAPF